MIAPYRLEKSISERWIIVNARDPELAWSGSHWVDHENGVATGRFHVATFASEEEARKHAESVWGI